MSVSVITVNVQTERDLVLARQRARQLAGLLGFHPQDQTRIATAISEIVRNALMYAGGGRVEFGLETKMGSQFLTACVRDAGKGIPNLDQVLNGQYQSKTGMGMGLVGTQRLMDKFRIETGESGTAVYLKKAVPEHVPILGQREVAAMVDGLVQMQSPDAVQEVQQQNQELLQALEEVNRRQSELERLNIELENTNRGVVALYSELDEKAVFLRRADELKTRFLSEMSHEFRTPLNSIIALARILEARIDGPLTKEQAVQVGLMQRSATELLELVNDLLDLAKVEAGKVDVRMGKFRIEDLFGALRGLLRPLQTADSVPLIIEDASGLPEVTSDEGKVGQVLRNFVSNALKFTEHGEVRVAARMSAPSGGVSWVRFCVTDTGIGIAPEDFERIFEDFTQVENRLQRRKKGTGLGLPLTRKLAGLLGGHVSVESAVGRGSSFCLEIPANPRTARQASALEGATSARDHQKIPVLVVEDNETTRLVYESMLQNSPFQVVGVETVDEAREAVEAWRPGAVILDVRLKEEETWGFLAEMKGSEELAEIPVVVATVIDDEQKARSLGADAFALKPLDQAWLVKKLSSLVFAHIDQSRS